MKGATWRHRVRRVALGLAAAVGVLAAATGVFGYTRAAAYDASVAKIYDVAPGTLVHTNDPAAIARGRHLAESLAECTTCHGADLGGGPVTDGGPIGKSAGPNVTYTLRAYSDGELERLVRHGIKKDGRTVRWMSADHFWLPDDDVVALLSYLRTVPPVERDAEPTVVAPFGKVMDQMGYIPIDIARRIDHAHVEKGPPPSETVEYGRWIARLCSACHGATMSGGPLPGTPPGFPVPRNLTPHATGLAGWTYDDLVAVGRTKKGKDGRPLADFMPTEVLRNMDETERRALWAYLQSLPPVPFGQR